jgi:hypothetical protein
MFRLQVLLDSRKLVNSVVIINGGGQNLTIRTAKVSKKNVSCHDPWLPYECA